MPEKRLSRDETAQRWISPEVKALLKKHVIEQLHNGIVGVFVECVDREAASSSDDEEKNLLPSMARSELPIIPFLHLADDGPYYVLEKVHPLTGALYLNMEYSLSATVVADGNLTQDQLDIVGRQHKELETAGLDLSIGVPL